MKFCFFFEIRTVLILNPGKHMGFILFKEFEAEFPIFYLGFALILNESISLEINYMPFVLTRNYSCNCLQK